MKLKRLFTPININGLQLKNRMVMPAIHTLFSEDGYPNERFKQFYYKRAEGGVGLIIVGGCKFDNYGGAKNMISLSNDKFIPEWKEFTEQIHKRDAKVAVQLFHAGRYVRSRDLPDGYKPLAPSAVYSNFTKETPKEMNIEELKEIIKNWASAALRAKQAGFDAVEILGSAGYLISQFLSPITNLREDEYGGSWENRCRFPLELVAAVREAVGPDYPIFMRIAGNDFIPGSNTNENAIAFAQKIEEAGIDLINVTGGWHETKIPQLPGEVPRAQYSYLAAGIKAAVNIPVIACNRINDPIVAEELLALERCDLVGLGRTLIADPDWCNKAKEGRFYEIRKCVACNQGCLSRTFFGKPVECLVNGSAGREYLLKDIKPKKLKNLLVIGAGPAGCEFAIRASELGHSVTIWEKDSKIGGQLHLAAVPPGKSEFTSLITYYEAMLKKYNVKIEMNKYATEEDIINSGYDDVIIATGSKSLPIQLPVTSDTIEIIFANEVLAGEVIPGKNVVIIGGGSVGCEVAATLAHKGSLNPEQLYFLMSLKAESIEKIESMLNSSDRNISIIEIEKTIGRGFDLGVGWPLLNDIKRLGVKAYTSSKVIEINTQSVIIEKTNKDGNIEKIEIPYNTIILAAGSIPCNELYEKLKDKMPNVHIIGDANKVGKIIDAVQEADKLAEMI